VQVRVRGPGRLGVASATGTAGCSTSTVIATSMPALQDVGRNQRHGFGQTNLYRGPQRGRSSIAQREVVRFEDFVPCLGKR
jgi:hypothetical protein